MKTAALAGGVGASKFLSGLVEVLAPEEITIIVNTGDDFQWLGLYICPDLDTITYTLSGLANPETGWGVKADTFHALDRLRQLGCDTWFKLGDRDFATHIYRTHRIHEGSTLTEITRGLSQANGIRARILPMTDSYVPTLVQTSEGTLPLQDYFVRRRCEPRVEGIVFRGIEQVTPAPGVLEALQQADVVFICPSNPFISIGPILAVPGIRQTLQQTPAAVIAVTPVIKGAAIKGPTVSMLRQLGHEPSAVSVARMYRDFINIFVLDHQDAVLASQITAMGIKAHTAATVMDNDESKVNLARTVLELVR